MTATSATATPRHFRIGSRPVSGLVKKRTAFPWLKPQWHIDTFALTYRCGGSTGFVHRWAHLFPV